MTHVRVAAAKNIKNAVADDRLLFIYSFNIFMFEVDRFTVEWIQ